MNALGRMVYLANLWRPTFQSQDVPTLIDLEALEHMTGGELVELLQCAYRTGKMDEATERRSK